MEEKKIVKFNDCWWVLHEIIGEMAVLWRDGKRALIPVGEIQGEIKESI